MSLSKNFTKTKTAKQPIERLNGGCDYTIALVGNPNVGKSTVFNGSTFWNNKSTP